MRVGSQSGWSALGRIAVALAIAVALVPSPPAEGAKRRGIALRKADLYELAGLPGSVAAGDFNHDGLDDIAVTTSPDYRVEPPTGKEGLLVFTQGPVGVYGVPQHYAVPSGGARGLDAGDVNGDGLTDLVAALGSEVAIFYATSDGTFQSPEVVGGLQNVVQVEVADIVPGPGSWGDIVVGGLDDVVLLQNREGESFFEIPVSPVPMTDLTVADVSGDGLLDIVTAAGNTVYVFEQNGAAPVFLPEATYPVGYPKDVDVVVVEDTLTSGDVTRDGRADITVAVRDIDHSAVVLNVFSQLDTGGLGEPAMRNMGRFPLDMRIGDVNHDSRNDLVISYLAAPSTVGVLQGTDKGLGRESRRRVPADVDELDLARVGGPTLGIVATSMDGLVVVRNTPPLKKVMAGPLREVKPAFDAGHLVWSRARKGRPKRTDVYVRLPGKGVRRVNRKGTEGWPGNVDGGRLVYQEIDRWDSDIRFYDLKTGRRDAPGIINSPDVWEWGPTISNGWILYGQETAYGDSDIELFHFEDFDSRVLDATRSRRTSLIPGQVNEGQAVWTRCRRVCDVYRYTLSEYDGIKRKVPNPLEHLQYAPSVASDGTVFFARSGYGCGRNVSMMVQSPGDRTPRVLFSLPRGQDIGNSYLGTAWEGGREVLVFDRLVCRTGRWDILAL